MAFMKHIGKHGDRKICILFRQVPGEDHMALVIYSDSLPAMLHDEVMKVVESQAGQGAKVLADALFRNTMPDGNNTLTALHGGKFLKKVQTKQIIFHLSVAVLMLLFSNTKMTNGLFFCWLSLFYST
jgi:hypothetical protein